MYGEDLTWKFLESPSVSTPTGAVQGPLRHHQRWKHWLIIQLVLNVATSAYNCHQYDPDVMETPSYSTPQLPNPPYFSTKPSQSTKYASARLYIILESCLKHKTDNKISHWNQRRFSIYTSPGTQKVTLDLCLGFNSWIPAKMESLIP